MSARAASAEGFGSALRGILLIVPWMLAGALLYLVNAQGFSVLLAVATAASATAIAMFLRPVWAAVFFIAFAPVNRFVIQALFSVAGLQDYTRLAFLWRDGILAVLVLRALCEAAFSTAPKRLRYLDLMVAAFVLLSAIYLLYPGPEDTDLFTRVQGFRTDASFLLAYFVGRGLALRRTQVRWLVLAIVPGSLAVATVAAWQFVAPAQANAAFDALGLSEARERHIGGVELTRASSLLLGDLALAFYQLVLVALGAALFFKTRAAARRVLAGGFLLLMLGTLLATVTRSAVAAAGPVLVFVALLSRAFGRLATIAAVVLTLAFGAIVVSRFDVEQIALLVNLSDASAEARLGAASRSFEIVEAEPFGRGLGTAGTIGQRFLGASAITNESWYLQLATEMGPASAVLYLAIVAVMAFHATRASITLDDFWLRVLALAVAGGAVGFLIVGNFLHAWENTVLSMLFWLYAGLVVRARELERTPAYRP